jgi:hypothetical protein
MSLAQTGCGVNRGHDTLGRADGRPEAAIAGRLRERAKPVINTENWTSPIETPPRNPDQLEFRVDSIPTPD